MRLKPDEIKKLADHLMSLVLKQEGVVFKVEKPKIHDAIYFALHHHFEEERMIDQEAERLVTERGGAPGSLDRAKALGMIRRQLAQEKDFILSGGNEGRFSEDKLYHLSHLVADKLYDDDLMDFPDEDDGPKYFKRWIIEYFGRESALDDKVRKKIQSQANAPFEGSRDWDVLFKKYREEELKKMGHSS
jgi:hypothetical protein